MRCHVHSYDNGWFWIVGSALNMSEHLFNGGLLGEAKLAFPEDFHQVVFVYVQV